MALSQPRPVSLADYGRFGVHMHRREFIGLATSAVALAYGTTQAGAATDDNPQSHDQRLRTLLDAFADEELTQRPELATSSGLDVEARAAARAKLNDYSRAGRERWLTLRESRLQRLLHIDRDKLSAGARINYEVVRWQYEHEVEGGRRFPFGDAPWSGGYVPYAPYVVSQLTGPYQSVPDFLASKHPIRSASDVECYLERLTAFASVLDASTEALRADAASGVLAPDFILDTTSAQLANLSAGEPAAHTLAAGLGRRAAAAQLAGDWQGRAAQILRRRVYPALERQRQAVLALRRDASHDAGIWKLRDGADYYEGALVFQTTTLRTPSQIHALGLEQVAELSSKLDVLLRAEGLSDGTVAQRVAELSRRPDQLFANSAAGRAELLDATRARVDAIQRRLPAVFSAPPQVPVEIVRVPPAIEDGSMMAYAQPPSLDGVRTARVYINLKDTIEWPKFTLPTLIFHEAVPGHQWQGAMARSRADMPLLRRLSGRFAAYTEGWGVYAEQLADELGAYERDPLGRIGMLQSLLYRAVRLVVDTGLHREHWSRERATDYFVSVTALPRGRAQREIDRYCVWPGQACSYKLGHTEWVRLRNLVNAHANGQFALDKFHDVLREGPMPLVLLEQVLRRTWGSG
jgi:uncharacterized protein (DUF885 family)